MMYVAQIYLTADSGREETAQIQEAVRRCGALAPDFEEDYGKKGEVAHLLVRSRSFDTRPAHLTEQTTHRLLQLPGVAGILIVPFARIFDPR